METKHTPGQWQISKPDFETINIVTTDKFMCEIPSCISVNEDTAERAAEAEANAKLIAALPKMIEFIGKVLSKLQEHQKEDKKIIAGYTLAANVPGLTDLLNDGTRIWQDALTWSE